MNTRMRPAFVQLESFRAFKKTRVLPIRPLTFLVGQNSTGKTSFLAALNFLFEFQEGDSIPSFGREPFDLGSFEQIAHKVTASDKPKTFSLTFQREIDVNSRNGILSLIWGDRNASSEPRYVPCRLKLTFQNVFGSAEISRMDFVGEKDRLTIRLVPKPDFEVQLGDRLVKFQPEDELPLNIGLGADGRFNPRYITYFLNQAAVRWRSLDESRLAENAGVAPLISSFGAFLNAMPDRVFASAPIRSTPERVYSASEGGDAPDGRATPYKLRRAKLADKKRWERLKSGFEDFGNLSGLFNRFDISRLTREEAGPFQINVRVGKRKSSIADVGYGVSQTLPIITDLIEAADPSTFLFQQPEVHLHPRAQAGLGTFLANYASKHLNSFIVAETHSDYLIDRVRQEIRKRTLPPEAVSILYFEEKDSSVDIHQIKLDADGNIVDPPACYRDFFFREQLAVLNLNAR